MEMVVIAVGSIRAPKLQAVREALKVLGPALNPGAQFEVIGIEVPSGVGHTPLGRSELMAGARGRSEALARLAAQRGERWGFFIGLEGGLNVEREGDRRMAFLESWAHVMDSTGRTAFGHSGGIALPERLAAEVLDRGTELSAAIDSYVGEQGIRDEQGAWGVLTRNLITRQDALRMAVIHAFAPFYNAELYASV